MIEELAGPYTKFLIIGVGGSGDVVATLPLARFLRFLGSNVYLGSVLWERWVYDPKPGPIRLDELHNCERIYENIVKINGNTYAVRNSNIIKPQAASLSKFLNEPIYGIDLYGGVVGVFKALNFLIRKLELDFIIGVDSGGDILAEGYEEGLWSPLCDQVMLAALTRIKRDNNFNTLIAVLGLGADGELPLNYLLGRISEIARKGGYLGARGLTREDVEFIEKALSYVKTEASALPIKAAKGFFGEVKIRGGTRRVDVSPITTIIFYLEPEIICKLSKMCEKLFYTETLWEAKLRLNNLGIYTELDLENDIYSLLSQNIKVNPQDLLKIRSEGIRRLKRLKGSSGYSCS